jgi:hypothetical protein
MRGTTQKYTGILLLDPFLDGLLSPFILPVVKFWVDQKVDAILFGYAVGTGALLPQSLSPKVSEYSKRKARKDFGRRSAIEPVVGHLKSDFRLARNYLKGTIGDAVNLLLAAAAFNCAKWMKAVPTASVWGPPPHCSNRAGCGRTSGAKSRPWPGR